MTILAIETSCDETAVAIVKCKAHHHKILANIVSSQVKIHARYGGVVPNLASREHLKNIIPCLKRALHATPLQNIDLIAVTIGPGLIPALLIGVNTAKALAYAWDKPIIGINHIEAHIYANWLKPISVSSKFKVQSSKLLFPALCLIVSGGHTQLILMKDHGKYKLLGQTRDDAVGEAFDKVAKLLDLGYPGGPVIAAEAAKFKVQSLKFKVQLPRPMIHSKNFDFSFSGLKTAVLYLVKDLTKRYHLNQISPAIAYSFQQAVIDVLILKTIRAAKECKVKTVMLAGGVAANKELRRQFRKALGRHNIRLYIPNIQYCTDNAVMVAVCAYYHTLRDDINSWRNIEADANLKIV